MSKCWYCNEEITTVNYCDEHIGICTKCYASMFQVSNDFVKGLMDKISDLEAKLAELNKEPLNCSQLENGMSLCVIQKSRIIELEEKLAESEEKVKVGEFWHSAYQGKQLDYDKVYAELRKAYDKNEQLKEQLSEKDKELKLAQKLHTQLFLSYEKLKDNNKQLEQQLAEKEKLLEINERILRSTKLVRQEFEQEKISFTVEKLEEVKHYAQHIQGGLINYIENQIKSIKGEK